MTETNRIVLDFGIRVLDLFRISIFGFWILTRNIQSQVPDVKGMVWGK